MNDGNFRPELPELQLRTPYLLFMGDVPDDLHAKTGHGIAYWRPGLCAGQMRLPGCAVDMGLPEFDVAAAVAAGTGTAVIGVASTGGVLPDKWIDPLAELARAGIDIAAGTHQKLRDNERLAAAAIAGGANLIDVRIPPPGLPVGSGVKRSGKRVLTIGTDCAVGKKYTALALHRELGERGADADFRASGQTGIMIAGRGVPIDAVVSDFVSGAAEVLSPANDPDHWDIIEGQGSLLHPSYAAVSLGLLHGSQPDAIVLCHEAGRDYLKSMELPIAVPPLSEVADMALDLVQVVNPGCFWAGISFNTASLTADERAGFLSDMAGKYGVPCVDPVATGVAEIADHLLERLP